MNQSELKDILDRHRISPSSYSLTGGSPENTLYLERSSGGWAVYYSERGQRFDERWFATESDACEHLLRLLLDDPTTRRS